ncbi:MAG: hypothetical protein R3E79_33045 [Caldilineaceae bacterium]
MSSSPVCPGIRRIKRPRFFAARVGWLFALTTALLAGGGRVIFQAPTLLDLRRYIRKSDWVVVISGSPSPMENPVV